MSDLPGGSAAADDRDPVPADGPGDGGGRSLPSPPDPLPPHHADDLQRLLDAAERARQQPKSTDISSADPVAPSDVAYLRAELKDYDVLERIHSGGQGTVYRAVQLSTQRPVAIKVLLAGPLATDHQRRRLAREAELISRLRHPNIVTLYDSAVAHGRNFIITEFVEGRALDRYVFDQRPPLKERVELMLAVVRAVGYAHQQGVIHRDLKPSNILVDDDGQPRVLDFGLAKDLWAEESGPCSQSVDVVGTLQFFSPEQARGATDEVGVLSDVYSLGVILYLVTTGRFPYSIEGTAEAVRRRIIEEEPARMVDRSRRGPLTASDISDDLQAIVFKALEKDPARRYQSAAALAEDLDRYLDGTAVEARASSQLYVLRKVLRRYRVHVGVAAVVLLLVSAAAVGMAVLWQRAERVATIAQAGLRSASHLRLGTFRRDESRFGEAITLLKATLAVGEEVGLDDPVVLRNQITAHGSLAEMYHVDNALTQAMEHASLGVQLAEQAAARHPDDLEWRRVLAFALLPRAKCARATGRPDQAMADARRVERIVEPLRALEPDNPTLRAHYLSSLRQQAVCLEELKQFDEAMHVYTALRREYEAQAARDPLSTEYQIELARIDLDEATWHMRHRTADREATALALLARVESRMNELGRAGRLKAYERDRALFEDAVVTNRGLIEKRQQVRSGQARPAEPPASELVSQ